MKGSSSRTKPFISAGRRSAAENHTISGISPARAMAVYFSDRSFQLPPEKTSIAGVILGYLALKRLANSSANSRLGCELSSVQRMVTGAPPVASGCALSGGPPHAASARADTPALTCPMRATHARRVVPAVSRLPRLTRLPLVTIARPPVDVLVDVGLPHNRRLTHRRRVRCGVA